MTFRLVGGDAIEAMQAMAENSVDAIVTDPPYGLEFMGKEWDRFPIQRRGMGGTGYESEWAGGVKGFKGTPAMQEWHHAWATEALRILKPGGHLLAFGGTRTYHRLACAIEDAGFEIRDCIAWMYGSGFPKSLDVSKAIDKANGTDTTADERWVPTPHFVTGAMKTTKTRSDKIGQATPGERHLYDPATPEAQRWNGWGTALKPAWESIIVATKPQVMSDLAVRIGSCLLELSAKVADGPSTSNPSASAEASGFAPSSAAAKSSTSGGSSDQTATSPFGSVTPTPSSIASSWKACWDDLCELTSMFTTGTTSSTTTALTTLSSCLEQITPAHITAAPSGELSSLAHTVDSLLAALQASSSDTLMLSAIVSATAPVPGSSPVVGEPEPAFEPIVLARKPLSERNVAANVQRWGTGALNIDGCRIEGEVQAGAGSLHTFHGGEDVGYEPGTGRQYQSAGRWPANVTLDETAAAMLDEQTGERRSGANPVRRGADLERLAFGEFNGQADANPQRGAEVGAASRFFYCPKADREERNRGVYTAAAQVYGPGTYPGSLSEPMANTHPTVKPVELMRWLCRMVTPKGGTVLDPFTGSGSTGVAAMREGFEFIGIEREAEYVEIARARIVGDAPLFNVEALT